jgi:hypothetical protein
MCVWGTDMINHFIRPFVPTQTHVIKEASNVNAMLLRKGIITTIYCDELDDYANGVSSVWNSECRNLWIIEHDIIPTASIIEELEECNYLICAPLYFSDPSHTGLENMIIPHRFYGTDGKLHWISAGMEFADIVGLGCVKIHKMIRHEIPGAILQGLGWQKFDEILTGTINNLAEMKFHIHNIWVEHKQL